MQLVHGLCSQSIEERCRRIISFMRIQVVTSEGTLFNHSAVIEVADYLSQHALRFVLTRVLKMQVASEWSKLVPSEHHMEYCTHEW